MADYPDFTPTQAQNEELVQRFANALYNVQLGSETMDYVLADIATFGSADATFNAYYMNSFAGYTDADVASLLGQSLAVDQATQDFIEGILAATAPEAKGQAVSDMLDVFAGLEGDPTYGDAATAWNAEIDVALAYEGDADVQPGTDNPVENFFMLTAGQDMLSGSAGDDAFLADIVQVDGVQVNSLGTGDNIQGGDGADALDAQVTRAATLTYFSNMAIQPRVNSVETIKLEALNADYGFTDYDHMGGGDANTNVFFNAKNVQGVDALWSWHSEANLIVQDMTTLASDGTMRQVSDLTVGMGYSGNDDSHWDESNFNVYFDQDYLNPNDVDGGTLSVEYHIMNQDAYDVDSTQPLKDVYVREMLFDIIDSSTGESTTYDLVSDILPETGSKDGSTTTTYAELVAALQAETGDIVAKYPALEGIQFSLGDDFVADTNELGVTREGTAIVVTIPAQGEAGEREVKVANSQVYIEFTTQTDSNRWDKTDYDNNPTHDQELRINVALEKVGLVGQGGDLVIGSMDKGEYDSNTWSDSTADHGIRTFDVTVYGDEAKSSHISELRSTNSVLEQVNVVTDPALATDGEEADYADLSILGNEYNEVSGLTDVQSFDSTGFLGDVTLNAELTSAITDKYLNLQDIDGNPAVDNVEFNYSFGVGDDSLDLEFDTSNGNSTGTVNREDFNLVVNGGAGNDTLSVHDATSIYNWYDNHVLNDNITINGDAGDDTILTPGPGMMNINGGTGDDTVYAENSGDKAQLVYNGTNSGNIDSDVNDHYQIYDGELTISYQGFEATVSLPDTNGVVSDLQVNQALKDVINGDDVLSKLLFAHDGPANSLVVDSLVDGGYSGEGVSFGGANQSLNVALAAPAAATLSSLEINQLRSAYSMPGATAAELVAHMDLQIGLFNDEGDYTAALSGAVNGELYSNNIITGGLGDDVLVLGTGSDNNDTVVYDGFGNGTDSIVNFVSAGWNEVIDNFNCATVVVTDGEDATDAIPGTAEVFTLNVTGTPGVAPGVITFDSTYFGSVGDVTVTPAVDDDAAAVATAIFDAFGGVASDFTVTVDGENVTFTANDDGVMTNVEISNDDGTDITYDGSGVGLTLTIDTDGVDAVDAEDATFETFEVTFCSADSDTTYTFDGIDVDVLAGETGANIAASFFAAADSFTDWTAVENDADTAVVTFEANDAGNIVPDITADDFAGTNVEVDNSYFGMLPGSDQLDFSSYGTVAVVVDGAVFGEMPDTLLEDGEVYVTLTESATNVGEYTMDAYQYVDEAGTPDTDLGLIGVADFGAHQDFVAENFGFVA